MVNSGQMHRSEDDRYSLDGKQDNDRDVQSEERLDSRRVGVKRWQGRESCQQSTKSCLDQQISHPL